MLAAIPTAPIGLERRTAASGIRDWPNLRTQQGENCVCTGVFCFDDLLKNELLFKKHSSQVEYRVRGMSAEWVLYKEEPSMGGKGWITCITVTSSSAWTYGGPGQTGTLIPEVSTQAWVLTCLECGLHIATKESQSGGTTMCERCLLVESFKRQIKELQEEVECEDFINRLHVETSGMEAAS
ncbi:hypothetical protein UY3_03311 [Chelonia mydas]|uniref:Uncharacterized protein n=1 Tax=Chelonia mydas TaxID=8469 RepID=M7CF33_CHEMY|nr:hypothetical protein UY3_03311 [Chelonia mydas]